MQKPPIPNTPGAAEPPRGRIGGTLVLLIFGLLGLAFAVLLLGKIGEAARVYVWQRSTCRIVASGVAVDEIDEKRPYRFEVDYEYLAEGAPRRSTVYAPDYRGGTSYNEAARLARRYPPGRVVDCYVDGSPPYPATIDRPSLWIAAALPIPLVFVAIGFGGIYGLWSAKTPPSSTESERRGGASQPFALVFLFFMLFFVVGASFFYAAVVRPLLSLHSSSDWMEASAVVISSRVLEDDSGEDTTYKADVLYAYSVDGEELRSNRIDFASITSGSYSRAIEKASRYAPGARLTCYVDPADPTDAVLDRSPDGGLAIALIPIAFIAVGGGGAFFSARAWWRSKTRALAS